jgi:hypothetical protein
MGSPADRRREVEGSPLQASAAQNHQSVDRKNPKKGLHSRGHNNSVVITAATLPQRLRNVKTPESLLFRREIVGRFCETPTIGFNLK